MSKFPEYKHEKSQEWFNRALNAIPSGVYGHLGPSEGLFLPITKWPLMSDHAKGTYFWDVDGNKYLDFMCAYGPNVLGYCDDDVDAEIQDMATQYQMKPEELKDMIGAPEMENIKKDIASRKALEFLGENCKEV